MILGFLLNRLARIGKIKIYQNNLVVKLTEHDSFGGRIETTKVTAKTSSISIELNFDFYNTSAMSPKIARGMRILIKASTKKINGKLKNEDSRSYGNYDSHADDLVNINLSPKEILNYNLAFYTRENFQEILDADWFIEFRNNKNRKKRVKINKELIKKMKK